MSLWNLKKSQFSSKENTEQDPNSNGLDAALERKIEAFCSRYVILLELLYRDKELNEWCRNYSPYQGTTTHKELEEIIYEGLMKDAYSFMPDVLNQGPHNSHSRGEELIETRFDLAYALCGEIRMDYNSNGYLINSAIGKGLLYRIMKAFLECEPENNGKNPSDKRTNVSGGEPYSLEYIKSYEKCVLEDRPGGRSSSYDGSLNTWRMRIQLDRKRIWFLSVFVNEDGTFKKYSLDRETAEDSHYEFVDENSIRKKLYSPGDEDRYFAEVLIRYVDMYGGEKLLRMIWPYITAQLHYD